MLEIPKQTFLKFLMPTKTSMISARAVIPTELGNVEAYLVEARSIGGLSGSPAFVRKTVPVGIGEFYLLGLMHGHWDIPTKNKSDLLMADDLFGKVNMGIAIVVPAKKIREVLNQPELAKERERLEEKPLPKPVLKE